MADYKYTPADFKSDQEVRWCPGCGDHAILSAVQRALPEIADALDAGLPVDQITYINGTVYRTGSLDEVYDYDLLPSWDDLAADKLNYARSFNVQQQNMDPITGHRLVEPYPNSVYVVQNPPSATLTTDEMDEVAENIADEITKD